MKIYSTKTKEKINKRKSFIIKIWLFFIKIRSFEDLLKLNKNNQPLKGIIMEDNDWELIIMYIRIL